MVKEKEGAEADSEGGLEQQCSHQNTQRWKDRHGTSGCKETMHMLQCCKHPGGDGWLAGGPV